MAGTYEIPQTGNPNSTEDPKTKTMLEGLNNLLTTENKLGNTWRFAGSSIIATEQERENVAFGKLTTADEIKSVVVPSSGLLGFAAFLKVKSSVGGAGRVTLFIEGTQLKGISGFGNIEGSTSGTGFNSIWASAASGSFPNEELATAFPTTGISFGGLQTVYVGAGTYNISLQFRATSGKVVAKERFLYVAVLGA